MPGAERNARPSKLREADVVTLGLSRNQSVGRIKGNQATFDSSQRNNLRSCVWVSVVVFGEDVRADGVS